MYLLKIKTLFAKFNIDVKLIFRICVPSDYMKFELPEEGEPTVVSIGEPFLFVFKKINTHLHLSSCYGVTTANGPAS